MFVSSRNAEQHNLWEVRTIRTPTMGEGSKTQPGGNLIEKQDTTSNNMKLHTSASSNAEQSSNFSFGITGNSSYLTPHIIVDAS